MMKIHTHLAFLVLVVLTFAAVTAGVVEQRAAHRKGAGKVQKQVEVWLAEPVSHIKGYQWPKHDRGIDVHGHTLAGRLLETTAVEEPCHVLVHLPQGKTWQDNVEAVIMNQDHDRITLVNVLPLSKAASYHECLNEVHKIAQSLSVKNNDPAFDQIQGWGVNVPGANDDGGRERTTRFIPGKDWAVFVAVKPLHLDTDEDKFFVSVDFEADSDIAKSLNAKQNATSHKP